MAQQRLSKLQKWILQTTLTNGQSQPNRDQRRKPPERRYSTDRIDSEIVMRKLDKTTAKKT
jgi:hypothetical protein